MENGSAKPGHAGGTISASPAVDPDPTKPTIETIVNFDTTSISADRRRDGKSAIALNRQQNNPPFSDPFGQSTMSDPILSNDDDTRPRLETDRLHLNPFLEDDAGVVQKLVNDIDIARMTRTIDFPYPEGAAAKWIAQHHELWQLGRNIVFAMRLKPHNELVGAVGLEIHAEDQTAELGYWIAKSHWNCGYATEASRAMIAYGFDAMGLNRIFAHHMLQNPASGRVMEKIGMQREGVLRKHFRKWGRFYDVAIYGMLHDDQRR